MSAYPFCCSVCLSPHVTYHRLTGTVLEHKRLVDGELIECDGSRQPARRHPNAERQRRRLVATLYAAGTVEVTDGMPPRKR